MNELQIQELNGFPGFYRIPGNAFIAINREGVCLSLARLKPIKQKIGNHGYPKVVGIKDKIRKDFTVHRLLALVFIDIPEELKHIPRKKLHVNHKDANKLNYSLNNLEWTTAQGNVQHRHDLLGTKASRAVLSRNVLTNEIRRYMSTAECSRYFGINNGKLYKNLTSSSAGRLTKDWCVFKFDDGSDWPILPPEDIVESKWTITDVVVAVHPDYDSPVIANTLAEVCNFIGIKKSTIVSHRCVQGATVPYKGWLFKMYDNPIGLDVSSLRQTSRKGRVSR